MTFPSNFLSDDDSMHESKHVAQYNQYTKGVVTDGLFSYTFKRRDP